MQNALLPAAALAAGGVRFVVVGSTALLAYGELARELPRLGLLTRTTNVTAGDLRTVQTSFGPIDLLFARGRQEYEQLASRACTIDVHGVPVALAARDDV